MNYLIRVHSLYTRTALETVNDMVFAQKIPYYQMFLEHPSIETLYQYQISHFKLQIEDETSREMQHFV